MSDNGIGKREESSFSKATISNLSKWINLRGDNFRNEKTSAQREKKK